ncbi:MAG: hypothetical protein MI919_42390, partial [Holophagales bacterium]|nr:hypothetical protein [Holophagales bacterium]
MTTSLDRRKLLASLALTAVGAQAQARGSSGPPQAGPPQTGPPQTGLRKVEDLDDRVDPWIELIPSAYLRNAAAIAERAGGLPVMAVLKNNAYGL